MQNFIAFKSLVGMAVAHPSFCYDEDCGMDIENGKSRILLQQPSYEDYESDKLVWKLKTGRVDVVGAREGKKESARETLQFALIYKI